MRRLGSQVRFRVFAAAKFVILKRLQKQKATRLTNLDVDLISAAGCLIGKTCIADLAKPMKENQHVRHVDLSSNGTLFFTLKPTISLSEIFNQV